MAITTLKNGEFYSSMTGHCYTSRQAAEHYESLERRRARSESEGEKILASLSTAQLKSLALAFNAQIEDQRNLGYGVEKAQEFFNEHQEIKTEGVEGHANGVAINTWLRSQGYEFPFSKEQMALAYSALEDLGVLKLDESKRKKVEASTEQPAEYTGLDAYRNSTYRFRSGW